jgi:hypothetical protein
MQHYLQVEEVVEAEEAEEIGEGGGGAQGGKNLLTNCALGISAIWKMKIYEILT